MSGGVVPEGMDAREYFAELAAEDRARRRAARGCPDCIDRGCPRCWDTHDDEPEEHDEHEDDDA